MIVVHFPVEKKSKKKQENLRKELLMRSMVERWP
jgi:hypothetical protein